MRIDEATARALEAADVRTAVDRRAIAARNLVIVSTPNDIQREKELVTKAHEDVVSSLAAMKKLGQEIGVTDEERRLIAELEKIEKSYASVALGIVDLALKGNREEASSKIVADCRPLLEALVKIAEEYSAFTIDRSKQLVAAGEAEYSVQRNLLIGASMLILTIAIAAGVMITRQSDACTWSGTSRVGRSSPSRRNRRSQPGTWCNACTAGQRAGLTGGNADKLGESGFPCSPGV